MRNEIMILAANRLERRYPEGRASYFIGTKLLGGGRLAPNQTMELTATWRTTSFSITSTLSPATKRTPDRSSSACFR